MLRLLCIACVCGLGCGSGDSSDPSGVDGGPSADADFNDEAAPTFGGATDVTPVGSSGLRVTYAAATDDSTAEQDIVYRAYVAASPGGQSFGSPDAVSDPGALEIVIAGLDSETEYFVVVRAVDAAGNEDSNTIERQGTTATQVSFSSQVQPILTQECLGAGCHDRPNPAAMLDLRSGNAYAELVGVTAEQCAGSATLVVPSSPDDSYMISKLTGIGMCAGVQMPKMGGLAAGDFLVIRDWIADGALDN